MLSLDKISVQFGGRSLFGEISIMVGPHDRIGLVGANGTGKSTLLKIIAGTSEADRGTVIKAHYVTAGYLPQDGVIASGKTLAGEAETAFEDVILVQGELAEVQQRLETLDPMSEEHAETVEIFGELQHKLEDLDAFRMRSKVERVLMGLGFGVADFERQTEEFSGGWQMRIALAKLLLKEPSLLLLDEPTNHLDLDSLEWLEEYLRGYNGAIILVSHDRAFLDSLTKKTLALGAGKLEIFEGNYSFFEKEQKLRREQQLSAYKNQQKELKQTQEFIERFRYKATKARQVQSRVKALEKIELIEIEGEQEEIRFHFPRPKPSGATVMELRDIQKKYGGHEVFSGLSCTIERGDRIAVVGINGAGKSTLSRVLAGVEPIDGGERRLGYNVIVSYFAQHQAEELDGTREVLQIVDDVAVGEIRPKLRTILGSFLFHGDDVFKKVGVLSGGEKSRLALAKMLLQPANFLIMDEPTNHLDMRSKEVLQEALREYGGTFLIVSHDKAFLDPIVTKVIEVSTGGIRTFAGNVSEYLGRKRNIRNAVEESTTSAPRDKDRKRVEAEQRQQLSRKLHPLREELASVEGTIASAEQRKRDIETLMADPGFYDGGRDVRAIAHEYKELQSRLTQAYFTWNEILAKISVIENLGSKNR